MKYFAIEGTFKDPIPVDKTTLDEAIKNHLEYLQKGFDEGFILVSGPKAHSGGGIIIMRASTSEEAEKYISMDPLKLAGIQEYNILEFKLHDCQPALKEWFKTE